MVTWNSLALFHEYPVKRAKKVAVAKQYLSQLDVFIIQETHGVEEDVVASFAEFLVEFDYHFSQGPRAAGGVLTFARRSAKDGVALFDSFELEIVVEGRIIVFTIKFGLGKELVFVNTHNAGFTAEQLGRVVSVIKSLRARASAHPLRTEVFIGGDFNVLVPGDSRVFLRGPATAVNDTSVSRNFQN